MMKGETTDLDLTVCAIGRNEGAGIARCGASLSRLQEIGVSFETIYVDSASHDTSAEQAARHFDYVAVLEDSPHLSASAGRHVGTLLARGRWIIYLDGDMELAAEILPHVSALVTSGHGKQGLAGLTLNRYPDGSESVMRIRGNRNGEPARGFGGAVILPRSSALAAGNWNPCLYANEEMELYGRIRKQNARVIWHDAPLALHHTPRIPKMAHLYGLFIPGNRILGKKFYGAGQVVVSGLRNGTLKDFLRVRPEPFTYLALLALSMAVAATGAYWLAAGALGIACAYALKRGGLLAPISYLAWFPQIICGLSKYPSDYEPSIAKRWSRKTGWTAGVGECIAHPLDANGKAPE